MKKLIVILTLAITIVAFTGCSDAGAESITSVKEGTTVASEGGSPLHEVTVSGDVEERFGCFDVVESWRITNYDEGNAYSIKLLVDPATGVMYYHEVVRAQQTRSMQICPLYNADGSLRIYEGD